MMWIGLVAHEPRKFSSQMFCYQICVASMELDSTPSTNTRMGPWRNATPNKSRQTSYYASLSQLSITESGSHQTNVLIATAMIWICHPQKLKLLQNTFWKYDTLTEWMQILSTIVAGLAWVWRRVFIQCQCLLKARDPSTENCRTSDPKSYSKQSGKKHFNFAPNEKTRVYCCLIYNVNNIIQQHVGKRMCFHVPYLSELILRTSYFQNHFGHFISKKWLFLLSKFRWSAFISPIWAGKWFWGVATGQFLYSWDAFLIYLPFDFDGA